MRLFADMNVSPSTVEALREGGWDIVRISDLLPADSPDEGVLDMVRRERGMLITQDLDFSKLLALGGYTSPSVVTLRMSSSDPESVARRLSQTLPEIVGLAKAGCALTIDDTSVRFRRLPI